MIQPTFSGLRSFLNLPNKLPQNKIPDIIIVGVPFDIGTSYRPGARFGPSSIRDISVMLLDGDNPFFRINPLDFFNIIDIGDLDLFNGYMEESLNLIEQQLFNIDSHIICLGGDHTISLPILRALNRKEKEPLALIHFDAHLDSWPDNFGAPIGHGTSFYYAAKENLIDPNYSIQLGIRSPIQNNIIDKTKELGFTILTSEDIHLSTPTKIAKKIKKVVKNKKVYLTFDIDCIDPSQAPGTGTPEIGGLFTWQILSILQKLNNLNWVGMDLVEVSPPYDNSQITALAGATIIWTYLCLLGNNKNVKN